MSPGLRRRGYGIGRAILFGVLALFVASIVQSLRHPARLWSPGLMGRVLAWDTDVEGLPEKGSAAP